MSRANGSTKPWQRRSPTMICGFLSVQSGENSLLGEYIPVSPKQFSRETIRPGIISLSQYEEDESKMTIDPACFDKIYKVFTMACATIQATVDRASAQVRSSK